MGLPPQTNGVVSEDAVTDDMTTLLKEEASLVRKIDRRCAWVWGCAHCIDLLHKDITAQPHHRPQLPTHERTLGMQATATPFLSSELISIACMFHGPHSPHKGSTQGIQFVWVCVTLSQCSAMLTSHSLSRNPQCTCVHGHHLVRRHSSHYSVLPPGSSRPRQSRSCQGTDLTRPRDVGTGVCACVGTLLRDVHPLHCAYERAHAQVRSYGGVWWTVVGGGWWW
jgi:hypothetical protein